MRRPQDDLSGRPKPGKRLIQAAKEAAVIARKPRRVKRDDAAVSDRIKAKLKRELGGAELESCEPSDNSAAGPDEGSATEKIRAIIKHNPSDLRQPLGTYEHDYLVNVNRKPPRKRPNDAFPSPYDGLSK